MLICMCMLTKRTNILFDQKTWLELQFLSKTLGKSIGELVREAVAEKYNKRQRDAQIKEAIDHIRKIRPAPSKTPIDYKALINHGRKY